MRWVSSWAVLWYKDLASLCYTGLDPDSIAIVLASSLDQITTILLIDLSRLLAKYTFPIITILALVI